MAPKTYAVQTEIDLEDFEPQPGLSTSTDDDVEFPVNLAHQLPHLVTQSKLNDLLRDLQLRRNKFQLLGS